MGTQYWFKIFVGHKHLPLYADTTKGIKDIWCRRAQHHIAVKFRELYTKLVSHVINIQKHSDTALIAWYCGLLECEFDFSRGGFY